MKHIELGVALAGLLFATFMIGYTQAKKEDQRLIQQLRRDCGAASTALKSHVDNPQKEKP